MQILTDIGVAAILLLQIGIVILEIFLWESPSALRMFKLSPEVAKATTRLGANQGLYNGFLAAGLLWGLLAGNDDGFLIRVFFVSCVLVAGIFGALTVNRLIILFQGVTAATVLLLIFWAKQAAVG
jgi:putative membrane protein